MSEIEISSGNVYADLNSDNADEMFIKAQLATTISEILQARKLTQIQAAEIVGLPQPKLSRLLNGHFRGVSEAKLMDCIARLGRNVRIVIDAEQAVPAHPEQSGRVEVVFG